MGGIRRVIIICAGLTTAFICREPYHELAVKQPKINLWASLWSVRKNTLVVILSIIAFINLFSGAVTSTLDFYVSAYYVFEGDVKAGAILTGAKGTLKLVIGILVGVFLYKLSHTIKKDFLMLVGLIFYSLCTALKWFTFNPDLPYLALLTDPLLAIGGSFFWVSFIAMKADACDWQEYINLNRSEGSVTAVMNAVKKTGVSIGILLSGVILWLSGFDSSVEGKQSLETVTNMRLMLIGIPIIGYLMSIALMFNYPLTKSKVSDLRLKLEARRGLVSL